MKTSIPNKLNHKLQSHAMMCDENKNKEKMAAHYFLLIKKIDFE